MPNPLQIFNEEERLAVLRSYNILDTASDEDFDELASMASTICETPIALISLVDKDRQWFKSNIGISAQQTPKDQSFCAHAIASPNDVMFVYDATEDERFMHNPLVTGDPKIVFYAGVPLVNEAGFALGTLCVIDREKKTLNAIQTNALKILAKQVITKLELRNKVNILEIANQVLLEKNIFINKFASMAAHDIKNPLSSILLASQLLRKTLKDIAPEQSLKLVDLNITATKNLVILLDEMLHYSQSPSILISKKQSVNLNKLILKIIGSLHVPEGFKIKLPKVTEPVEISSIALEQIILNLLTNAIRYNNKEVGEVAINFEILKTSYILTLSDNGIGISETNLEKIFENNFSIQNLDRFKKKGTGIGLATVNELVKAMNGEISVKSQMDVGTTFSITFKR